MSDQAARRFMHVAEAFGGEINNVLNLTATALYELAAPSTPDAVREAVGEVVAAGGTVSVAEPVRPATARKRGARPTSP